MERLLYPTATWRRCAVNVGWSQWSDSVLWSCWVIGPYIVVVVSVQHQAERQRDRMATPITRIFSIT